ncbi:MAG: DEAD/DEAH box helicase family protein [Rhodanobacter sp.]
MTPEAHARTLIDGKLETAGWVIQDIKQINPGAASGIAVREYPTDTGPADYVLFVDRLPVGVIEAKRDEAGENLTAHEAQTERYASARLKWRKDSPPLRFLYESTGQIIHFTDGGDPRPRAREVFHFFQPRTLAAWAAQPDTLRQRLAEHMPPLPTGNLRDCQISAVTKLEQSLAMAKPRALIHMATGAGKTFTAITSVYRLLKFAGARRILFLVDTRNLGKQAHQEFMAYSPPDDGRKFTELYNVQRLSSSRIDPHAQVCISTIQRMYSILSGEEIDESAEDISAGEAPQTGAGKLVRYNPAVPIETFDFIVIDECHRSIYNLWKQVLDYFDAFLIGLTATPDNRTYGFFKGNVVAEYSYEQSVVDGVNVMYDVYEIETEITRAGAELKAKEWVDHRERQTRAKRWAEIEEDTSYSGRELDRSVVNPDQIRQVIKEMKRAVETSIYPSRKEVPKTLIFAKTDSHADDIIATVREVYGESLKKVSNSANGAKTHFVLIDAVGVEKSLKTESRPLEKKPGVSLDGLLKGIAIGSRDDDTVLSLGSRLVRLSRQLDDKALARIKQTSGGLALNDLARGLVQAVDPDRITADALDAAKAAGITRNADTLTAEELEAARQQRVAAACQPFDDPELRDLIESARHEHEQLIDHVNRDQLTFSGFSAQAEAEATVQQSCNERDRDHRARLSPRCTQCGFGAGGCGLRVAGYRHLTSVPEGAFVDLHRHRGSALPHWAGKTGWWRASAASCCRVAVCGLPGSVAGCHGNTC